MVYKMPGTNREKMRTCIKKAENARDVWYKIRDAHVDERELSGVELDYAMNRNAKAKGAIADNRWYMLQADMYSGAATAELLPQLLVQIENNNLLLEELLRALNELGNTNTNVTGRVEGPKS